MVRSIQSVIGLCAAIALASSAIAAEPTGAVVLRIPADNIPARCVNVSSDRVWLGLRRLVTNRDKAWFSEDRSVGVLMNTTLEGYSSEKTEKVSFPRMIEASVKDYESGRGVSVPIEFQLLVGFQLQRGAESYTNIQLDFSIVRKKKRTSWGHVLNALADVTKRLPIPASPFGDGFKFFADYANSAVAQNIMDEEKESNLLKQAAFSLSFSPTGTCADGEDFSRTGTIAVVKAAAGSEEQGFVDITRITDYAWKASLSPAFTLSFCRKSRSGECAGSYKLLQNDYIGFFLNAVAVAQAGGRSVRAYGEWGDVGSTTPVSWSTVDHLAHSLGEPANVSQKVLASALETALRHPIKSGEVPFGKILYERHGTFLWELDKGESIAIDTAHSLRRCELHGVEPEGCL